MKILAVAFLLVLASWSSADAEARSPAGRYRLVGEPDVASTLLLQPDGRFVYMLSAGALDEQARGRWANDGKVIRLTTEPAPKPPVFALISQRQDNEVPLRINVQWPNGRGIPGVDIAIAFDDGPPLLSYTQEDGWRMDPEETRMPRSVTLAVPMHGLSSPAFHIDAKAGNDLNFTLTPNDLGIVDFRDEPLTIDGDNLLVERGGGRLVYRRE